MKEILERFKAEKLAVNCQTEEEAKQFVKLCYENGIEWYDSAATETFFNEFKDLTFYAYSDGNLAYGTKKYINLDNLECLTYQDFMKAYNEDFSKSNLKTGMHVELRNGERYLVVLDYEGGAIVAFDGCYGLIKEYKDNLQCYSFKELDIMRVYKTVKKGAILDTKHNELIWEREETKELTVDEVSNLLGYSIKIVGQS